MRWNYTNRPPPLRPPPLPHLRPPARFARRQPPQSHARLAFTCACARCARMHSRRVQYKQAAMQQESVRFAAATSRRCTRYISHKNCLQQDPRPTRHKALGEAATPSKRQATSNNSSKNNKDKRAKTKQEKIKQNTAARSSSSVQRAASCSFSE